MRFKKHTNHYFLSLKENLTQLDIFLSRFNVLKPAAACEFFEEKKTSLNSCIPGPLIPAGYGSICWA